MKNRQVYSLAIVAFVMMGCAAQGPPAIVPAPETPAEWKIFVEKKVGCPDVTGEYELIPRVADLQKDDTWLVSDGNWYDFILLIPTDRVKANKWTPNEPYSRTSFFAESVAHGHTLRITFPDKNGEHFLIRVFSTATSDLTCEAGNLVFPEFQIHGGTEGAFLSGRIYRAATITTGGDLLFYEQIQSHKSVHRYYLFKMKSSNDASG